MLTCLFPSRLNSLMLADELRVQVAEEIGLGQTQLVESHQWPALDFGWSLADVFKKCMDGEESISKITPKNDDSSVPTSNTLKPTLSDDDLDSLSTEQGHTKTGKKRHGELEIGTWSNDMAFEPQDIADELADDDLDELDIFDPNEELPDNLTILAGGIGEDEDDGELGADWGTGLKERKAKSRSLARRSAPSSTPRSIPAGAGGSSKGGGEIFRVGSPSNFDADDDGYDGNSDSYGGDKHGSGDAFGSYEGDDEDDFDDYWDEYEAYSEAESVHEETELGATTEWVAKGKRHTDTLSVDDQNYNLDLLIGGIDQEELKNDEKYFTELIDERKQQILKSSNYFLEDQELVFEKSCRPPSNTSEKVKNCAIDTIEEPEKEKSVTKSILDIPCDQFGLNYESIDHSTTLNNMMKCYSNKESILYPVGEDKQLFSFDLQPNLISHCGPSPSVILQALTMSNANDGVNLERLETIGDSYLKYAITTYLYCTFSQQHEGKLSYLRSKQVSNLNLYRLGKYKGLGECMVATKFEPHDNWLPPSYYVPRELEEALIDSGVPSGHWNMADLPNLHDLSSEQIRQLVAERTRLIKNADSVIPPSVPCYIDTRSPEELPIFIPYNLLTQHSIPDKSIADSVEALIGAYLTTCGPKGALLFMSWLGIKVLPTETSINPSTGLERITFSQVAIPKSPLNVPKIVCATDLHYRRLSAEDITISELSGAHLFADSLSLPCPVELPDHRQDLELLLAEYHEFETIIGYQFVDRSYLLQAFTHASFCRNRLTDCYQRLEFLGDAVLGQYLCMWGNTRAL